MVYFRFSQSFALQNAFGIVSRTNKLGILGNFWIETHQDDIFKNSHYPFCHNINNKRNVYTEISNLQ